MKDETNSELSPTRPTLDQIARRAHVSEATVSRALNNHAQINQQTVARIRTIAKQMGYMPRRRGPEKQRHRSKTIGLVVADSSNPLFSKVVRGVQDTLSQRGYNLILSNSDEDYDHERHAVEALLDAGVEGLLLTPSQARSNDVSALSRKHIPFVLVGRRFASLDVPSVVADDVGGAQAAAEHLLRLGHRDILVLTAPSYISSAEERLEGFRRAYEAGGLTLRPEMVRTCPPRMDSAFNTMKSVLVEGIPVSAVFTFNDLMMLGVIRAAREHGRKTPSDLSLVGFDDIEFVSLLEPPLTTVHMPKYSLGRESARLLLSQLSGRSDTKQIVLPTELIVRGSTARAGISSEETSG